MIVVGDTSPLTNLAAVKQFDLLRRLFGRIHIPEGVWAELGAEGKPWPGRNEVAAADWVERHATANTPLVRTLQRDLDRGEAEAIALALELGADLVLLDEREGRRAAQRLGLRILGVVGILIEAKKRGLIARVGPLLDALRSDAGFYLGNALYARILELVEEADTPE